MKLIRWYWAWSEQFSLWLVERPLLWVITVLSLGVIMGSIIVIMVVWITQGLP